MTRQKPKKSKKPAQKRKSAKRANGGHIAQLGETSITTRDEKIYAYDPLTASWVTYAPEWQHAHPVLSRCLPWLIFAAVIGAGFIGHFTK